MNQNTSSELANRVREVYFSGKWIANTNFKEILSKVTLAQATKKIGSLNTIMALTYHVNYYLAGLINVFKGGQLEIKDKFSFDFNMLNSEEEWIKMKSELDRNAELFAQHVEQMTDTGLNEPFVKAEYGTFKRNIEGIIEHSYYHLGQISLILKLISESEKV